MDVRKPARQSKSSQYGIAQSSSAPAPRSGDDGSVDTLGARRSQRLPSPWIAAALALILALLATLLAYNQKPNADITAGADSTEIGWWLYPWERNAVFNPARDPAPPVLGTLRAVRAAERGEHVFAVGDGGTILYSHDGGDSWRLARGDWQGGSGGGGDVPPSRARPDTQQAPPAPSNPAQPLDAQATDDSADNLADRASATNAPVAPSESPEDIKQDILDLSEQLQRTQQGLPQDESKSAKPQGETRPDARPNFVAVDADEYGAFVAAATDDGRVAISENGGRTWRLVARSPISDPGDIAVTARGATIVVSQWYASRIAVTRDRGQSWQAFDSGGDLLALAGAGGADHLVKARENGINAELVVSRNGFASGNALPVAGAGFGELFGMDITADGALLFAIVRDERDLSLRYVQSNSRAWQTISALPTGGALAVSGDARFLAYQDVNAFIHRSRDTGQSFERLPKRSEFHERLAFALGADGTAYQVAYAQEQQVALNRMGLDDADWSRIDSAERYARLPAPWLGLVWLSAALVALRIWRQSSATQRHAVSAIADIAVSDSPLRWNDADHLDFKPLALSVSAFIRNENTQAPLTIAVTGPWGTGKSSLMRLIEHDLKANRFRPVWFNAWHAQEEQQLLAALLTAVRDQAAPPWWTPLGVRFRARMLVDRGLGAWLKLALLMAALAAVVAAVVSGQLERLISFGDASQWSRTLAALIGTGGSATLLIGLVRGLTAFREQPAKLLAAVAQSANVATLDAQLSFRHRFAREFALVTQALEPYTLTIFIDDLDRCLPKQVVDTLEAVNFLTTAGQCVVVFGMARAPVEAAVSETYRAQFKIDKPASDTTGEASLPFDEGFAHRYLDKLINLEIPVPRHGAERAAKITEPSALPALGARARLRRWLHRHRAWAALALLALPLWFAASVVRWATPTHVLPIVAATSDEAKSGASSTSTDQSDAKRQVANEQRTFAAQSEPGSAPTPSGDASALNQVNAVHLPALALTLLAGIAGLFLRERRLQQENILHDSDTFRRALRVWSAPVAQAQQGNPRALKRFVNWLRYLAMADRMQHPDDPMPEDALVGLASVWRAGEDVFATLTSPHLTPMTQSPRTDLELLFMDTISRINNSEAFAWPPEERHVARFANLCEGIVAR